MEHASRPDDPDNVAFVEAVIDYAARRAGISADRALVLSLSGGR